MNAVGELVARAVFPITARRISTDSPQTYRRSTVDS